MDIIDFIYKYYVELFLTSFIPIGTYIFKNHRKSLALTEAYGRGIQALLKHNITQSCMYYQKKKRISLYEMQTLEVMYKSYIELNGNGLIREMMDRVNDLEIIYEPTDRNDIAGDDM